jgi:fructose-1,6-bisphosphatase I
LQAADIEDYLTEKYTMNHLTLNQFLQKNQQGNGDMTLLINEIAKACQQISTAIAKGALTNSMGSLESENIQGETQKQLDVITNEIFIQVNEAAGQYVGMASEEMDDPYEVPEHLRRNGKYLLLFDPLDGSSNVNLNISVGTIFSIITAPKGITKPVMADFLKPGTTQICSGYALYGPSTMLVVTTGQGVNGFTLDSDAGEFYLTHPAMNIAPDTNEFSINMSNQGSWEAPVQRYISECQFGIDGVKVKEFNMRWVGSMVAEVHRILMRGGIFIYPIDHKVKDKGGKLRLMYEANPMSFIVEQAGGVSSTGRERIMQLTPEKLHQRVPVVMGSKNEVDKLVGYYTQSDAHRFSY